MQLHRSCSRTSRPHQVFASSLQQCTACFSDTFTLYMCVFMCRSDNLVRCGGRPQTASRPRLQTRVSGRAESLTTEPLVSVIDAVSRNCKYVTVISCCCYECKLRYFQRRRRSVSVTHGHPLSTQTFLQVKLQVPTCTRHTPHTCYSHHDLLTSQTNITCSARAQDLNRPSP